MMGGDHNMDGDQLLGGGLLRSECFSSCEIQ